MFKSAVVLALLAIVMAMPGGHKYETTSIIDIASCFEDYPLTEEDKASLRNRTFPSGKNAPFFFACFYKTVGFIDDKGTVSLTNVLNKNYQDEELLKVTKKIVTLCSNVNDEEVSDGEKGCDRAKLVYNCIIKNQDKVDSPGQRSLYNVIFVSLLVCSSLCFM